LALIISSYVIVVLCALIAVPLIVLLVQVVAACLPQSRVTRLQSKASLDRIQGSHRPRIAVMVPAHNEALGIRETLDSLRPQLVDGDRLLVVADNCSDTTAAIALDAGAEVIERSDPNYLGKAYALDYGVQHLANTQSPGEGNYTPAPEVLIIIDADCRTGAGAISCLASACAISGRPVQALNLMSAGSDPRSLESTYLSLAEFAWILKNQVRPLGSARIGLPCQLMGSGMALPWPALQFVSLASGNLVEDCQLGLDFARLGLPPLFCPQALISSRFPNGPEGRRGQRRRWEHGSLSMLFFGIPRFLAEIVSTAGKDYVTGPNQATKEATNGVFHETSSGIFNCRPTVQPTSRSTIDGLPRREMGEIAGSQLKAALSIGLLAMVLDLCVPPIALLTLMVVAVFAVAVAQFWWLDDSMLPLFVAGFDAFLLSLAVGMAWFRFGREAVSLGRLLLSPAYAVAKLPLYGSFIWRRQKVWTGTKRDGK